MFIEFSQHIHTIKTLPSWKYGRVARAPKSYDDFFESCLNGGRRSGRSTRLMRFYADKIEAGDNVLIIDHCLVSPEMAKKEDKMLFKMVCKELEHRGYHRTTDYHLIDKQVGHSFLACEHELKIRLVTNKDVDMCKQGWKNSIAFTTAIHEWWMDK